MARSAALFVVWGLVGCVADDGMIEETVSLDDEEGDAYDPLDPLGKADGFVPVDGPLVFEGACAPGDRVTIAAVGDVLLHGALQRQAFSVSPRYRSLWLGVEDLLQRADITYANLEGPTADGVAAGGRSVSDPGPTFDNVVYTSYPAFNYHPTLIDDLLTSGVDIVSTANNHGLDRAAPGVDRTVDNLDARGLPLTGTRKSGDTESTRPWFTLTRAADFQIAWLACTYATNGITDRNGQVLFCYRDADRLEAIVRELGARADIDAVIVTPHWGLEYSANPDVREVDMAHRLLDAGALAIIGSHPHVLQPWELHTTPDGRETFALYSLGNFVSGQTHLPRRSTLLLYLGLTRTSAGSVVIHGARYVPLHMTTNTDGSKMVEAIDRVGGDADSRELTVAMFGSYNVYPPGAPLVLDPQCDPGWEPPSPPHPHDGWIGGSCVDDRACGGTTCVVELPGGLCTEPCTGTCADRAGRALTFCVDLGLGGGHCVAQCTTDAECRTGWVCRARERFGEPPASRLVCVPAG